MQLTDEQVEEIAEKAAQKAVDRVVGKLTASFYQEVGKSVVQKGLMIVGLLGTMLLAWAHGKGYISLK